MTILLSALYNFFLANKIIIYIAIITVSNSSQYPIVGLLIFNSSDKLNGNITIAKISKDCLLFVFKPLRAGLFDVWIFLPNGIEF